MTFPSQGLTKGRNVKPVSRTPNTQKALGRMTRDMSEAPPKRRRQLTAQAPAVPGNPFGKLQQLTTRALGK